MKTLRQEDGRRDNKQEIDICACDERAAPYGTAMLFCLRTSTRHDTGNKEAQDVMSQDRQDAALLARGRQGRGGYRT